MTAQHVPLAPVSPANPGPRPDLVAVDCSCGWEGRFTLAKFASAEHSRHAAGEVMLWEDVLTRAAELALEQERQAMEAASPYAYH